MLRVGLIGLGKHSMGHHVPALQSSSECRLVAVCDSNPDLAASAGQALGVAAFTTPAQLLRSGVDMAVVSTPHHTHAQILAEAAEARVHVLKEKPFARNLEEALAFVRMFRGTGRQVLVYTQRRYSPVHKRFESLLQSIGRVFWIEAKYTLHVRDLADGWRADSALAGGGCIVDMGYHMIDLLTWYFGLPELVQASYASRAVPEADYDAEDSAHLHFAYPEQCMGTCLLSRRSPPKTEQLRVIGTDGIAELGTDELRHFSSEGELLEQWGPVPRENHFDAIAQQLALGDASLAAESHLPQMAFVDACYMAGRHRQPVKPGILLEDAYGSLGDRRRKKDSDAGGATLRVAGHFG